MAEGNYLVEYFDKYGKVSGRDTVNSQEAFKLVQKAKNERLDDDKEKFTIHEIGKCVIDFS